MQRKIRKGAALVTPCYQTYNRHFSEYFSVLSNIHYNIKYGVTKLTCYKMLPNSVLLIINTTLFFKLQISNIIYILDTIKFYVKSMFYIPAGLFPQNPTAYGQTPDGTPSPNAALQLQWTSHVIY